jgi:nicotinamidase-related amidase
MDKTLVIVDMQEFFTASYRSSVQEECIRLIKYFKRNKLPIIVLEYDGAIYGKTHQRLQNLYKNYPYVKILKKRKDDGSDQVHRFMRQGTWGITKRDEILICGVNIRACVWETTMGLLRRGYRVCAVQKACNCIRGGNNKRTWADYPFGRIYTSDGIYVESKVNAKDKKMNENFKLIPHI